MAVTRIKNNQITDSTITYAKIASGTLVGSNFNANLTLNSNVSIIGNLTVTGTSSTVSSTNTYVNDPLVVFNNGYTGSLSGYDIGILVNRNLAALNGYGSVNTAWVWVEADNAFEALATTDTGGGITSINNSGFANVKVGNLTAVSGIFTGSLDVTNAITAATVSGSISGTGAFSTLQATNFSSGNAQITGGSITGGTGQFSTLTATNFSSGNIVGALTGTSSTANVSLYDSVTASTTNATFYPQFTDRSTSGNSAAYVTPGITFNPSTNTITATTFTGTFSGTASITSGSVTGITGAASTLVATNFSSGNAIISGGNLQGITYLQATNFSTGNAQLTGGSITGTTGQFSTLTATNFSTANAVITGGSVNGSTIGASTASSGRFTTIVGTDATNSTNSSSGALQIAGGASITKDLWIGGNLYVANIFATVSNTLTIEDPLVYLQSPVAGGAYNYDIGIYSDFTGGSGYNHTGVVRNYVGNFWGFFSNVATEPGSTIYWNDPSLLWDSIKAGDIISANTTPSNGTTEGALRIAGGAGIAGNLWAGSINTAGGATLGTARVNNFSSANVLITGGSITGFSGASTYLTATNFSSGNAIVTGGSIDAAAIGQTTPSSAKVTTLNASSTTVLAGNVVASAAVEMTQMNIGALVIPNGGISVSGNAYVGNNLYIGPNSPAVNLTAPTIVALDNGTAYAQLAMINTANSGSADFIAYGNNYPGPSSDHGWMDVGFTGDNFNDPKYTLTKSNDGYAFASAANATVGGNLVLATDYTGSYNDIVIGVGSFFANAEVARFHGNVSNGGYLQLAQTTAASSTTTGALRVNGGVGITGAVYAGGVVNATSSTDSSSTTTGALVVTGGTGVAGNVYAGKAAFFNASQTSGADFKVSGVNSTNLLWAKPGTYDQVMIGNTAAVSAFVAGAKLQINSTDSMLLPVGTSAQRPGTSGGTDTAGMVRYNSTLSAIEYYGGSTPGWQQISTQFTVIADEQFNGDGTTTVFTLSSAQTTNSCIISINGVIQIPTLAYAVTGGTTLTFTEAPASGDVIDVRKLTTTQTITQIASDNGFDVIATNNTAGIQFYSGAAAQTLQYTLDTSGAWVTQRANTAVASANTATAIDTFATATYRSAKYVIQATAAGKYQTMEALVIHDDTTPTVVSYGIVQTNGNVGVLSAGISGGVMTLNFIGANANTNVRVRKEYTLI